MSELLARWWHGPWRWDRWSGGRIRSDLDPGLLSPALGQDQGGERDDDRDQDGDRRQCNNKEDDWGLVFHHRFQEVSI